MTDIYKVVPRADWETAADPYRGSAHDRTDGFLHFSTWEQLPETLRLYYAGQDDLVLVAVDAEALGAALKWEHAPSRSQDFPHLYAPLPLSAVTWTGAVTKESSGAFVLPIQPR
jgi:uncharacterized protein (DUF952 family)